MKFNLKYFFLTILFFVVEILIATVGENIFWLRAYFGDILVVILIYTFIQSFFEFNKTKTIIAVVLFAFIIEIFQYFHFAEVLGFGENKIAMTVLGNSFSWIDILCYTIGGIAVYFVETKLLMNKK